MQFAYPVDLEIDEAGRVVASISDVPGCHTDGADEDEALAEAADALAEALAALMLEDGDIPAPSPADGRPLVVPDATLAAKAALYMAVRERHMTKTALAALIDVEEKEARRLLDPHHASKMPRLERALNALGRRVVLSVDAA